MKKERYYLDTSIINHSVSLQNPEFNADTKKFLNQLKKGDFKAYTSELVLEEIKRTSEPKVTTLLNALSDLNLEDLEINKEIEELAEEYIKFEVLSKNHLYDAIHIAIASYYDMDAIITWNFEHMIKKKTKQKVPLVNSSKGYKPIDFYTPQEVIDDD